MRKVIWLPEAIDDLLRFSLVRLETCMLPAGRPEADKERLEVLGNENIFHKYALFT
jgi:hypothetical protein